MIKTAHLKERFLVIFLILWGCLAANTLPAPAGEGSFRFVVFGDNRSAGPEAPLPESFPRIISEVSLFRPDLVFHTGDFVSGGRTAEETEKQYRNSLEVINKLPVPFYLAPGNHEFNGAGGREIYKKMIGPKSYYSLDFQNSHFIILNTDMEGDAGWIRGEQMVWLKNDLEKNKAKEHIFVFFHRPPFAPLNPDFDTVKHKHMDFASRENRDELVALFAKYHVNTVFSAHEHLYATEVHQGVRYTTTAGLGAPMYAPPEKGGFLHYLLVSVDGREVTTRVIEPWHLFSEFHENDGNHAAPWVILLNTNCESVALDGVVLNALPGDYAVDMAPMPESFRSKRFFRNASAEILEKQTLTDGASTSLRIRVQIPPGIPVKVRLVNEKSGNTGYRVSPSQTE